MAFNFFGLPPSFYDFSRPRQSLGLPERPSIDDLMDPLAYPQYPEEPELLARGRQLGKDERRQLTMQMLANVAQALSGAQGDLGGRLGAVASANIGAEQEAVGRANETSQQEYRRKYQRAERDASSRMERAKREQDRSQIESMLAVGDKAIELAGGAEADPAFATKVFSLMRERNASALNSALNEAVQRRTMREKYKLDPEDPLALEAYRRKQALDEKVEEFNALDPLKDADELDDYEQKKIIDRRYPAPREPQRDRMWFDPTSAQIINLDSGQVSAPVSGYVPRPRSGGDIFDEVEEMAWTAAQRDRAEFEKDNNRPRYQAKNPAQPGYLNPKAKGFNPLLIGKLVPFNLEASYRAHERARRKIANEKAAQADPSSGNRGAAPATSPQAKGVQSPKGAPVGMGGGLVNPAEVKRRAVVERKVAAAEAKLGPMSKEQKTLARKKLETMTVEEFVAEAMRRRGGG